MKDGTHELVGTDFVPGSTKKGNELVEPWLARLLEPQVQFRFTELEVDGSRVVLLEVERATSRPVAFQGTEFIRIGSSTRKLRDHPTKERQLWRLFLDSAFEDGIAAEHLSGQDILQVLDYPAYFHLLGVPPADGQDAILKALTHDELITSNQAGGYDITNLGAILFARRLAQFPGLKRKAVRLIRYRGSGRMDAEREQEGGKGYATGFNGLVSYVHAWTPSNEVLGPAFRREIPMFPPVAIRELVANALIHQDFTITGAGPMIEIFDRRLEISNPGEPLVDTQRFLDSQPRSRNEKLASLMRRLNICEERGTGIDKVVAASLRTSGTSIREASRIHAGPPVRPQAVPRNGPPGASTRLLHARLPSLRDPAAHDELFPADTLRDRRQKRLDGVPYSRRCRRGRVDRSRRPGGRSPLATVPAVLGAVMTGCSRHPAPIRPCFI